jgi:hypothetical protein
MLVTSTAMVVAIATRALAPRAATLTAGTSRAGAAIPVSPGIRAGTSTRA